METAVKHKLFLSSFLNSTGKDEVSKTYKKTFDDIANAVKASDIELIPIKNTSDIWMRDYMPIQIDEKTFVTYRYQPDYLSCKERSHWITRRFSSPAKIAENREKHWNDSESRLPFYAPDAILRECRLILDGGNVVVCGDRVILTDKVFIENRPLSQEHVLGELRRAFGKEVIIIPSDPHEIEKARNDAEAPDLPLCHADGALAPIEDDTILIADYGSDPQGYVPALMNILTRHFHPSRIHHLDFSRVDPGKPIPDEVWVYINFLRLGDLILVPRLGGEYTPYDETAVSQLESLFPTAKVKGINTRILSLGEDEEGNYVNPDNHGCTVHCVSWEVER